MATIDIEKLKNALLEGKEEAKKYITIKDGGACNFDSELAKTPRNNKITKRRITKMNKYIIVQGNEEFPFNVQVLTRRESDKKFYYCGNGRFCKTMEETKAYVEQYKKNVEQYKKQAEGDISLSICKNEKSYQDKKIETIKFYENN